MRFVWWSKKHCIILFNAKENNNMTKINNIIKTALSIGLFTLCLLCCYSLTTIKQQLAEEMDLLGYTVTNPINFIVVAVVAFLLAILLLNTKQKRHDTTRTN